MIAPATAAVLMRELPDVVRRASIAASPNVVGYARMLERARNVQVRDEKRRTLPPL